MTVGEAISKAWTRNAKMDWIGLESALVGILRSEEQGGAEGITDSARIAWCKEAIDAFTHRGHFPPTEYPNGAPQTLRTMEDKAL